MRRVIAMCGGEAEAGGGGESEAGGAERVVSQRRRGDGTGNT